jgi:hypothetical protein
MPAPRMPHRPRRTRRPRRGTRATVAAFLLPAILLLQLSCDCGPARAASAPRAHATGHGCCPDTGHQPAPGRRDHDPVCGHCHLTLAPSGGTQASAVWSGLPTLAPSPRVDAPRSCARVLTRSDRAASDTLRLRTCVLLL